MSITEDGLDEEDSSPDERLLGSPISILIFQSQLPSVPNIDLTRVLMSIFIMIPTSTSLALRSLIMRVRLTRTHSMEVSFSQGSISVCMHAC